MKRSTAVPVAAVLSALALTLTSCAGSTGPSEGEVVSGGTFVTAVGDDPGDLNPLKAVSPTSR